MYPKKFSLSFIFLYPLCAISISLSLSFCCSFHNSIKHTYSFCAPFFLPFCLLLFLLLLCVRVCVIYIISLLQKFTLIVGTIFWHFGFTTLRAVCVVVAVAVFDNFFVVVEPYVKLVSLPLSPSVCLSASLLPQDSFSTTHSALHHLRLWQHVRFPFVCLSFSFILLVLLVLLLLRAFFLLNLPSFFGRFKSP